MKSESDTRKRAAAIAAVAEVESGMKLGLGTGSTMAFALDELARRIQQEGLRVVGIPTSSRTEARARQLGIPLTDFAETETLDLAIDGADELLPGSLTLIKGLGGALLRERIVAAAARRFVVVVDSSKLARQFATRAPVPVEVVPFGHEATARRLTKFRLRPVLRADVNRVPISTDGGNLIYDCHDVDPGTDPAALAVELRQIVGVIDSGIFVGMATEAIVAHSATTIRRLKPELSHLSA
ncbi:MAG TPA: ribose 5-phosphate isomerase A [Stellaceae bacterium]|nr:ribose 5-phosphate isomerase A [Stellaceae bacterium]